MELTVDGRKVFAVNGGKSFDPSLPAILFLHGAACDHSVWALQTRWFAHHGRAVLAVDLPGHGKSEGDPLESIGEMAEWAIRVLDAAGLKQAALVGHSMGGFIALEAAARHPDRVWALGLLGLSFPMAVNEQFLALAKAGDHKAVELMNDWLVSRKSHIGGHRVPGLWLIGGDTRLIERYAVRTLGICLQASARYDNGLNAARSVRCPVLMILGENDSMTPLRAARALAKEFPAAEVTMLKDCGHMMMSERPDETLDALKEVV